MSQFQPSIIGGEDDQPGEDLRIIVAPDGKTSTLDRKAAKNQPIRRLKIRPIPVESGPTPLDQVTANSPTSVNNQSKMSNLRLQKK